MQKKKKVFDEVKEELTKTREKMIERYARRKKTKPTKFKVGSKVQYRNLGVKKLDKKKYASRWYPQKGFLVVKEYDEQKRMLHLRNPNGKKVVKKVPEKAAILWTGDE